MRPPRRSSVRHYVGGCRSSARWPRRWRSLGAQLGVVLPTVLVFGEFAVVGIVANLAAVPVAGLVMLYGLPASLAVATKPVMAR